MRPRVLALVALLIVTTLPARAQDRIDAMTLPRLIEILVALDPETRPTGLGFEMTIENIPVLVIADVTANRMRAMVSIRDASDMTKDEARRVLQANFDTALDARYAIANGRLYGTFIHPLGSLTREDLISGLGQTVNLALTYGTFYTGGALTFGRGDSDDMHRDLIDRLMERGQDL